MKAIVNAKVLIGDYFEKDLVVLFDDYIESIITKDEYQQYLQEKKIDVNFYEAGSEQEQKSEQEQGSEQEQESHRESMTEINGAGSYLSPGFIDVHIHGYKNFDVMDANKRALNEIAEGITENGVTAFLATTMTMSMQTIRNALDTIRNHMERSELLESESKGAMILGAHLEGPFINAAYKGAQPGEHIVIPDTKILEDYGDIIKVVTLAPEIEGALDMISRYKDNTRFSIGHSGATFEEAMDSFKAGASSTTHLFNAMTGLHHRKPGIVGAAFLSDCYCEIIADNFHVHKGLYPFILKAKTLNKILLITDCMRAGGLAEGEYELGGQKVWMKNKQCTLADGTIAGSVLKLNEGLRNFATELEGELESYIQLVSKNQAEYLGVWDKMGSIEVGKLANLVLIDEAVHIIKTIVKGNIVYETQV
jgi:N-acetylglucosamine-6-phosphate deacetylase